MNIESVQQNEMNPVTTTLFVIGTVVLALGVVFLILYATHPPGS